MIILILFIFIILASICAYNWTAWTFLDFWSTLSVLCILVLKIKWTVLQIDSNMFWYFLDVFLLQWIQFLINTELFKRFPLKLFIIFSSFTRTKVCLIFAQTVRALGDSIPFAVIANVHAAPSSRCIIEFVNSLCGDLI